MKIIDRVAYSDLITLPTFEERFLYLQKNAQVGNETFGDERYLNQIFYKSPEWRRIRDYVIARDSGCDLAYPDYPIVGPIYIHHLNPITPQDILDRSENLLDPENLICVSFDTHNAIHYGSDEILNKYTINERTENDTCPWK